MPLPSKVLHFQELRVTAIACAGPIAPGPSEPASLVLAMYAIGTSPPVSESRSYRPPGRARACARRVHKVEPTYATRRASLTHPPS